MNFSLRHGHAPRFWSPSGKFEAGPRCNFGCVTIDRDRIFIAGGYSHELNDGISSCFIWNSLDKSWLQLPDLPEKMAYCRAARLHNFVYVLGESEFYRFPIAELEFERIEDNHTFQLRKWKKLPVDPIHGTGFSFVSSWESGEGCDQNAYLYRVGGSNDLRGTAKFCPIKNEWEILPLLQTGRYHHACIVVKETIYAIGGVNGHTGESLKSTEFLCDKKTRKGKDKKDDLDHRWRSGHALPITLCCASAIKLESDYILVTGGKQTIVGKPEHYCFFKHYKFSLWRRFPEDLFQAFGEHSAVTTGENLVYIMGGINNSLMMKNNMTIYTSEINLYNKGDRQVYLDTQNSVSSHSLTINEIRSSSASSTSNVSNNSDKNKESEEADLFPSDWRRFFSCCAVPNASAINYDT